MSWEQIPKRKKLFSFKNLWKILLKLKHQILILKYKKLFSGTIIIQILKIDHMEILNGYNAIRIDDYPQRQCRNAILYSVANFHFLFELKGRSERRGQWENKFKKPNLQQRRIELYILHKWC